MHKSNPFSYWIWLLPFLMVNLVNKYKIILPEKRAKPMLDFLKSFFEVCQKPKSNQLSNGILTDCFFVPNLVDKYKYIFLGKRVKPWISPWFNVCSRLYNGKFGKQIQKIFSGKSRQTLKLSENFLPALEFPIDFL